MMFCPNSSNQMNPSNNSFIRLNGWSQVVPICMPWGSPTSTLTTTPINNPIMNGIESNRNVIQFTANTQPMNLNFNPSMVTPINSSVTPTQVPTRVINNEMSVKSQLLCPDPCTSQTATRWELLNNIPTGRHSSHQHLKRRSDSSDEEFEELRTPIKQHINEDKVSAIFNRLQITNNHIFDDKIDCEEFEEQTNESKNSIVLADELQTVIKNKTITDRLVQNELNKHSKALVLWQPITPLYPPIGQNCETTEEVSDKTESDCCVNQNIVNTSSDLDIETIDCNDSDNDMELCL